MNDIGQPHATIGFQPVDDNVLIRLVMTEIPSANDAVEWGEVIAVGPGRQTSDGMLVAPNVAIGDRIALRPRSAMHIALGGESFAIVGGADVLGVLLHGAIQTSPVLKEGAVTGPSPQEPPLEAAASLAEESLETDVAPDLLDREAPTSEDLH